MMKNTAKFLWDDAVFLLEKSRRVCYNGGIFEKLGDTGRLEESYEKNSSSDWNWIP